MDKRLIIYYRYFIVKIIALLFLSTSVNAQLTMSISGTLFAIDDYTLGENTQFKKSVGKGDYKSPDLNHITIIKSNNLIKINKGCWFTIQGDKLVIKENDVIHNNTGNDIQINDIIVPNSKVAYIINNEIVIKNE